MGSDIPGSPRFTRRKALSAALLAALGGGVTAGCSTAGAAGGDVWNGGADRDRVDELTWVERNGARMPVVYLGNPDSDTVVLVCHGGPGAGAIAMIGALEALTANHLVAFWDQRFAGYSVMSPQADPLPRIPEYGADAAAVCDAVRARWPANKLVVWGGSWGGAVVSSLVTVPEHQDRYDGWIVVNGTFNGYENALGILAFARRRAAELSRTADQDYLAGVTFRPEVYDFDTYVRVQQIATELMAPGTPEDPPGRAEDWLSRPLRYFPTPDDAARQEANQYAPANEDLFVRQLYGFNPTPDYLNITRPGLLIWGEKDPACPIEAGRVLDKQLTAAGVPHELAVYPDSWHVPYTESPDRHTRDVIDFIDGL